MKSLGSKDGVDEQRRAAAQREYDRRYYTSERGRQKRLEAQRIRRARNRALRVAVSPHELERRRAQKKRNRYRITAEVERELRSRTHCEACGDPFGEEARGLLARHIDHDHRTGRIRGVLHHRCNTALGLLGEDRHILSALNSYLLRQEAA